VYFLKDHLGSIRATVDNTGAVVGYDDYDPWGYILANRSLATPWSSVQGTAKNKFTGKEWDDDFGVNWGYHINRYYDHQIGRWMVRDPLAEKFPSWSPYVYTLDNPVKFDDPTGGGARLRIQGFQPPPSFAEIKQSFLQSVEESKALASAGLLQLSAGRLGLGVLEAAGSVLENLDPFGMSGFLNPVVAGSVIVRGGRTISKAKRAIGELLSTEGKTVEFLAESGTRRTADALVEGVLTEFKTVSNITSKDISGALARRILEGRGQAGNIIIDARGQKGLTKELAENAIIRAFVKDSDKKLLKEIRIIGEDFDISIPRSE
jgi:RHS repeat-associated protein